jgi:hypothetical protein
MAHLTPTSDPGRIAAIDSGEQTPRINLKPTTGDSPANIWNGVSRSTESMATFHRCRGQQGQ